MELDSLCDYISGDRLFHDLTKVMGEWLYIMDDKLRLVYANNAARAKVFCGIDPIGHTIFELFPRLTIDSSISARTLSTGIAYKNIVQSYLDINGDKRASLASTYPIKKNGRIIGVCEFGEDITGIVNLSDTVLVQESRQRMLTSRHGANTPHDMYYTIDSIIGNSQAVQRLKSRIVQAANSDAHLFIYGETGTGKEMVAQSVYMLSRDYTHHPFVAQNCAAIPEALLESILFGTVKGAFTGAESRPGLFEAADGGVMYLDEINSMPQMLQAKLLRVIEQGKVTRVGSVKEIKTGFRLISSTNASPASLLENNTLRPDLYYRLNVLYIEVPPLRKRCEDIPLLADYFISQFSKNQPDKKVVGLTHEALGKLMNYEWPGNVRELRNVVERAFNNATTDIIDANDIDIQSFPQYQILSDCPSEAPASETTNAPGRVVLRERLRQIEIQLIREVLERYQGNVTRAARELDIPQQTLYNKIKRFGLQDHTNRLPKNE